MRKGAYAFRDHGGEASLRMTVARAQTNIMRTFNDTMEYERPLHRADNPIPPPTCESSTAPKPLRSMPNGCTPVYAMSNLLGVVNIIVQSQVT